MSLYDGFNALGIGNAALSMNDAKRRNRKDIIDLLQGGTKSLIDDYEARKRKQELLNGARSLGISDEISSGLDAEELARYIQGVKMQQDADAKDEKKLERLWKREDELNTKKRGEESLDKGFAALKDMLLQQMAKASGPIPSQKDIDEYNRAYSAMKSFVEAHPEYGVQMADVFEQNGKGLSGARSLESYFDEVKSLNKNGKVSAKDMDALHKKYIDENVLATLMEDKNFLNTWNMMAGMVDGDPLVRNALMLGAGDKKTEGDAKKALNKALKDAAIDDEKKRMAEWYKGGSGEYDFSNAEKLGIKIPSKYLNENKRRRRDNGKK